MSRLSSPIEEIKEHYDVVVVGTGYGGAIAASRLSRAGRRVCVLERGSELRPGEYPATELEMLEATQIDSPPLHEGSRKGLYDIRLNPDLNVLMGCGLGGTSLINANVSLRPDARVFEDPSWPQEFRADVTMRLADGFWRAEEMLKPQPYPDDAPALAKLQALETSARAMNGDGRFYRPPINVTFSDGVNHVGVEQRRCLLCGDCVSGCNHHAKNTLLMNYLPDAWNHGADIFTGAPVRRVERAGGHWAVHYQPLKTGREAFDALTMFVTADVVILAAGALGSTEILLRSAQQGLSLSDQVGTRLSGNGDVLAFAYNAEHEINGIGFGNRSASDLEPVGPCITGIIDLRDGPLREGMVIEEGAVPGGLGPAMPGLLAAADGLTREQMGASPHRSLEEDKREADSLLLGPRHGAVHNTQTFLVMTHDDDSGRLALEDDRLRIAWPDVGREPIFESVEGELRRASATLGASYVRDPIWNKLLGHRLITVHPLGGCPMGSDAATGAVDHKGRVYAGSAGTATHDGLYVTDGSVVPCALGVNPLLTISALTERCCSLIAEDRGWTIDYALPSRPSREAAPTTVGVEFTERMSGFVSISVADDFTAGAAAAENEGQAFSFILTIHVADIDAFVADPTQAARMAGTVSAPALSPKPLTVSEGTFNLFSEDPEHVGTENMRYRMRLSDEDGNQYWFEGFKVIHDASALDVWHDTTTLYVTLHDGPDVAAPVLGKGILRISPQDFRRQLTTMRATGASGAPERLEATARFGFLFAKNLFDVYGGIFARETEFDPDAPPRKLRQLRVDAPDIHAVTTDDGTELRLTRFRGAGAKGPVLVTHGLGVSSRIFTIDTVETNLLEYLFAHGYDVWLLDYRASIELPSARTQFTADDIATRDYPAAVKKVRELTGADSIQVVAHCFGALTFSCAMLAGLQGVRSAVISQISTDVVVPLESRLKAGLHLPDVLDAVGVDYLDAYTDTHASWKGKVFNAATRLIPEMGEQPCESPVCHRISFMYAPLYRHEQLNNATHEALHEMFGLAGMASFRQLARMIRAGHVVDAAGDERYMPHLDRMAIPMTFIHGAENACFSTASIDRTVARLSQANGADLYTHHEIPGYGHIDCIFGRDAVRDVYPHIVTHLEGT